MIDWEPYGPIYSVAPGIKKINNLPIIEFDEHQDRYLNLKKKCEEKCKELDLKVEFIQSNVEGEMVSLIQSANEKFDGIIINAAAFTHTSVAIRDALEIYKKKKIEVHISNIYKREEFRQKSLISDVVNGGIFGLGYEGYILAIIAMHKLLKNEN